MAIDKLEYIKEDALFGQKLFQLGAEIEMYGPASIAKGIYDNYECFKLVKPGGRTFKDNTDKMIKMDKRTIARNVQRHFECKEAIDVPGNYMKAYSILFNCSMDYLYGIIEEKCPNVEVLDISKKTGLSIDAVDNIMSGKKLYLNDYLFYADYYGFLDERYDNIEDDDWHEDIEVSIIEFWNRLLESEEYIKLPENWFHMACALYSYKAVKTVLNDLKNKPAEVPSWDEFISLCECWRTDHQDREICIPGGYSIKEMYEQDKNWAQGVYRDIINDYLDGAEENAEGSDNAYWGIAGKFDRYTLGVFHELSEKWCISGPLRSFETENTDSN